MTGQVGSLFNLVIPLRLECSGAMEGLVQLIFKVHLNIPCCLDRKFMLCKNVHCSLWPVQTHVCSTECLNASEMRVCITKTKHCLESHTTISSKLHLDIKVSKHALNDIQEICHVTFQTVQWLEGPVCAAVALGEPGTCILQ